MKPRSLVLITVDCLRADHVGFLGYSLPTTPFLDSLAAKSVVFEQAIVAGAPTYFSFPAILVSRHPLALGRDVLGIAPQEATIATALKGAGYATAAFLAGNPYLSARFGYHQGFDHFRDFLGAPSDGEATPPRDSFWSRLNRLAQSSARRASLTAAAYEELYFYYCQWRSGQENSSMDALRRYPPADVIIEHACTWLNTLGRQPFFLWLHLMDPHHPYYPPEQALASFSSFSPAVPRARFLNSFWNRDHVSVRRLQRYKQEIVSLYDAGVYWVDQQISRLVQALKEMQRWQESVLAVTADHGEEFLEQGNRYHSPVSLPEQLIHVPLLLRAPELAPARFAHTPFSLLHLAPTLLDAAGISVPTSFQGRSHWREVAAGDLPGGTAIVECVDGCTNPFQRDDRIRPRLMAVRDEVHKLVINFRENRDQLYDLKNDPGEHSPLPSSVAIKERSHLLQLARAHLEKASRYRNADLGLRARLREFQQSTRGTLLKTREANVGTEVQATEKD